MSATGEEVNKLAKLIRTAKAALSIRKMYGGLGSFWYQYHHI
jgi:hypothetical protein